MGVGKLLAEARIARGLSIEDVARTTRIRAVQIQAVENESFDSAEAVVFLRARIRAIAACVGVPEADALAAFESSIDAPAVEKKPALAVADNLNIFDYEKKDPLPPRRSYTLSLILTGIALLAIAAWFSRSFLMGDAAPLPLPTVTISATPTETELSTKPAETVSPTEADPSIVNMQIAATEASWIQVKSSNGDVLLETTLQVGAAIAFSDPSSLTVRVGNAGGVQLVVNGENVGTLGDTGQVVERVFGLGDPSISG